MYNQEYSQYAHYYDDNQIVGASNEMEFVNINGQLIPVIADIK